MSKLDKRLIKDEGIYTTAEINNEIQKLVGSPTSISKKERDEIFELVVGASANRLLADLITQRGSIPHEKILLQWIYAGAIYHPITYFSIANWVIESYNQKRRSLSRTQLSEIYPEMAGLIFDLAKWLSPVRNEGIPDAIQDSLPGLASKYEVFKPGEVEKAKKWITTWLEDNARNYVKICDPYFGYEELEYLKCCPENARILIITTDAYLVIDSIPKVKKILKLEWNKITSRRMPLMQILVVPKSLEGAFHDRVIITESAGLDLGQSLNGLGKKFGKVAILNEHESKDLEKSYVENMLNQANWFMNHQISPIILTLGE